ncbi:MAG: M48 family metallopeptidase [Lachnospiraceae bacterium]|nr:M48 family metallopeptidase [Lachnospiraceae bacterium]
MKHKNETNVDEVYWETPYLRETDRAKVIRSDRRTMSVQVDRRGEVILRIPRRISRRTAEDSLRNQANRIDAGIRRVKNRLGVGAGSQSLTPFTPEEMEDMRKRAASDLKPRVAYLAGQMDLSYGQVSIRFQKTRWGSCSSRGNISLNALLVELPEELRDYVIVHELCHLKHMDHSPAFWEEVTYKMPEYKLYKQRLHTEGAALMARLP